MIPSGLPACITAAALHCACAQVSQDLSTRCVWQAVSQAAPRMLQPALTVPPPPMSHPAASSDTLGLLWAISIIAAIRLGRASSETDRLKLWTQVCPSSVLMVDVCILDKMLSAALLSRSTRQRT